MLSRAGSNDPDSLGLVPPLLVPVRREPDSSNKSVTGSERRVKLVTREYRDDITDDSSVGDGTSVTYSERDSSKRSRSDTVSSEDSETSMLEWDAAMAQLLYESSADAVILVSPDLLVRALNVSAQHMFGYFSKEVVGQNFQTFIPRHFRRHFSTKIQEIIQNTRPGDMEEIKEGYCERKAGDQFNVIFRVANNLASTSMEPGLVITVHDESEYLSLQARAHRRLKDLARQVEAKEAMLLKAQAIEERELLQAQTLKEHQMKEKKAKKKEFLNELKEIDEMRRKMTEEYAEVRNELIEADMLLKQQIEAAKLKNDSETIHKLELERLRTLFKREAQDLELRQRIQSEEIKITHMRLANVKSEKQLKESQQMKLAALKESQTLRRFRKEQRSITKSQKLRQISELRETQIEELEALKRKHRNDLFTITNETRRNTRKMKYEQEKLAADMLEQQTKIAAEIQIAQQKEAQQLKKARDRDAEKIRIEQEAAAKLLLQNQEEILQILARRHHDEQTRFSVQLEEKKHYELLAQNCSDMISLHNVDNFACKYVSPSCESLLGYSQEEMQYLNYMDLVHLDNRNEAREAVRRLLEIARGGAKELPSCQQVFRMRRKDGSNVWVERAVKVFWSRTRLKSASDKLALTQGEDDTTLTLPDHVVATSRDDEYHEEMELLFTTRNINQRKEMEEQRRRAEKLQAQATTATQVKRDFLAFIGHECRNPLNALFNVTDFLMDTGLDDQQGQYVGIIKQCCGDMLRILNDLLDLSKIEAGKIDIEVLPFNIRGVINDAVRTMQAQAAKKALLVTYNVEDAVPKLLMGDASRIRQILLNMISNAIKFTEKGKVHIAVAVHDEIDEDNLFVQFKVIDTGIGIDEDVVTKLFTMYGQASVSDYRKYGGSGIGLRLCALLVQQSMGGNIGIESVKGEGTTVWFTVPFNRKITEQPPGISTFEDTSSSSSPLAIEDAPGSSDSPQHVDSMEHGSSTASQSTTTSHTSGVTESEVDDYSPRSRKEQPYNEQGYTPKKRGSQDLFVDAQQYEIWASPKPLAHARRTSAHHLDLGDSYVPQPPQRAKSPQHTTTTTTTTTTTPQPTQIPHRETSPEHVSRPAQQSITLPTQPQQPQAQQPQIQQPQVQQSQVQQPVVQQPVVQQPVQQPQVQQPQVQQPQQEPQQKQQQVEPTKPVHEPTRALTPTQSLPQASPLPPSSGSPSEKPMVVLVVDDIPLNRDIAVALLTKENCKCDVAVDGVEAVAAFKLKPYDLVLLDIQMPRMTGTEAIYYLREYEKTEGLRRVPVVAISGNVQASEQASYFQAGMDGFLAKPFKRDEFLRMLNKYKPKPESPRAIDSTPQKQTLPASTKSADPLRDSNTFPQYNQAQTAPVQHTKSFSSASPVPFNSSYSEQALPIAKSADMNVTPTTNRRASVSAVASPYNLIPLNSSFGMPPIREDEDYSTPSPAPKAHPPPYPNTPSNNSFASPSPSTTRTPWPSASSRRASSPSRITTDSPRLSTPPPSSPSPSSPPPSPPRTPSPEAIARSTKKEPSRPHSPEQVHAVRILVADNSSNDRQIYKKMLSQYQADIVASGMGALDLFDTNNYDVILLDCNLEDMYTRDLVEQIRRKEQLSNQHVPIVLVCTTAKQEEEFRGVGVSQILIKGRGFINRDILLQALLRSVNIVPGDKAYAAPPNSEIFDTSELVDSLFLAQISRSSFFSELFQLFIGCTEKIVVNMSKYVHDGDVRGLVIEAHNCSSISANIGAVWLSRLATDLRVAAAKVTTKQMPPEIPQMVDRVIHGVDLTLEYLEKCRIISKTADGKWTIKKMASPLAASEEVHKDAGAGKTRVLVVDDMPMTQFIVTTLLSKLHFVCDTVSNGVEAIDAISKNTYDLVLMDNYMDQMTGLEAVAKIRASEKETGKHIPVIGLTSLVGNNPDEVVPVLIKAGMDDIIFKPILRNSFLSRLEIWRPQLAEAFTWTVELDTILLDELVQSAPPTITQAIPRLIEISNRVGSMLVQSLREHQTPTHLTELIELCAMLGATRLAEVAKILYQYLSSKDSSEYTVKRLIQIYAVVRASTVDALNKYAGSRAIEIAPYSNYRPLSPASIDTTISTPSPSPSSSALIVSPSSSNISLSSSSSIQNGVRILVADDQPLTRMVIKSMVEKTFPGVIIEMAENGELAVAKADTTFFHLILMDIGMPKMDGYRASQLIRASEAVRHAQPMAIVAITAGSITKAFDATAYQEAGMNELIHKPFNNSKLVTIFNKYIFEKDKNAPALPPAQTEGQSYDSLSLAYPDEMILNSEILDMLRGLGILERTVETFEKHSRELLQRARSVDPGQLQKRSNIRQSIHALKGISLNSGASMLGRMCDDLERVVLECDKETVTKMLDMIEAGFEHAMKRFRQLN